MPATFLLESETIVIKKDISGAEKSTLTDDAFLVYEALEVKALSIKEIIEILGKKNVLGLLQDLFSKGVVDIHQKLSEKYKPKLIKYVRFSQTILETHKLEEIFEALKNAPKQKQLLMGVFDQNPKGDKWKKSKELLDKSNSTLASLRTLINKGIMEEHSFRKDRSLYDFKKLPTSMFFELRETHFL